MRFGTKSAQSSAEVDVMERSGCKCDKLQKLIGPAIQTLEEDVEKGVQQLRPCHLA
jgi:hypothetical protein